MPLLLWTWLQKSYIFPILKRSLSLFFFLLSDIEIHYRPTSRDLQLSSSDRHLLTMKDVLASIPGFPPLAKLRGSSSSLSKKSGSKKMSASAALQQVSVQHPFFFFFFFCSCHIPTGLLNLQA